MKFHSKHLYYSYTKFSYEENFIVNIYMMVIQNVDKKSYDRKFKMAAMPIYGRNHSNNFFSRTARPIWPLFCMKQLGYLPV